MAYKQNPGRGPMMKTGKGVPSALLQVDPTDPVKKKTDEKSGSKSVYPGKTYDPSMSASAPKSTGDATKDSYIKSKYLNEIKGDSLRAVTHEKRAIKFGDKLPVKGKSYKGHGSRNYNVSNIDAKTGATTFNLGRSSDQVTVSRQDLMKKSSRNKMKDFLGSKFDSSGYVKK
jgi:hypothetical protein